MAIERLSSASEGARGQEPRSGGKVRVITLNHAEHHDATLYRFDKGTRLRWQPGPSLLGRRVFLYCNYTSQPNEELDEDGLERHQYRELEWRRGDPLALEGSRGGKGSPIVDKGSPVGEKSEVLGSGALVDDTDMFAELLLERAGPYHYYFVYETPESRAGPVGSGWWQVWPTLPVPADAISCLTVLSKCLGPLPRWRRALAPALRAGYNAIHFTPVQALGASQSAYSVADQERLDPRLGPDATHEELARVLDELRAQGVVVLSDVVLNHTANETPWLATQPDASYNCANCPHLRPAALLDALLFRCTLQAAALPAERRTPDAVRALAERAAADVRLHELLQCDCNALVADFCQRARNKVPAPSGAEDADELQLTADPQRRRLAAGVDMERALRKYNVYHADCADEEARLKRCCAELRARLDALNQAAHDAAQDALRRAVDNCMAGYRYERLQADGPRLAALGERAPLFARYFTWPAESPVRADSDAAELEALAWGAAGARVMAHNGWVMDAAPLDDFAAPAADGRVYLRRELVAWGDSVKLRYGAAPRDSPFLWAHMRAYVRRAAALFDGLRLDNCHSTPVHVAERLLAAARAQRPDLYVTAELFTNSDHVDNVFVNRLGINSLIREAMSAWDAHELGRQLHRYGGRAVGAFARARAAPARARVAHALLYDVTHDNPSPFEKRCAFDILASAALVSMSCNAIGSTRGIDEFVPHHIHVVNESRLYQADEADGAGGAGGAGSAGGGVPLEGELVCDDLTAARRALNELHAELARDGYEEVYVDQMDADVVAVTRHNPRTRKSVILVAFTAFKAPDGEFRGRSIPPLRFQGQPDAVVLEGTLLAADAARPHAPPGPARADGAVLRGAAGLRVTLRAHADAAASPLVARVQRSDCDTEIHFHPLQPSTIFILRVSPTAAQAAALAELAHCWTDAADPLGLAPLLEPLALADLNALLFRCDAEEREAAGGAGAYEVPGRGALAYAGLQGARTLLDEARAADDLAHPLCAHLRAGDWLAEYTWRRLARCPRLAALAERACAALRPLGALPRYLVPAYFERVLCALHGPSEVAALARMRMSRADAYSRALALTSVQLLGAVRSAPLPAAPAQTPSLSAGLPHFAVGYMRCWGRDTFIALRGLMLLTHRYQDARAHLLGFAACLRHGLIPNLLDGGVRARYNCRDAVWWWLHSLQAYVRAAPDGAAVLSEPVTRLFPSDDAPAPAPDAPGVTQPLHDVVQEALDAHFQGRAFRERNAGRDIDAHMADRGFNVQIGIDPETGFPFGGNDANCGTWMDKMGSSERAGTRGRPATPRDGSAVELVALAHAAAAWLADEHRRQRYPYPGVLRRARDGGATAWTWAQWADRIRANFERHFWIPSEPSAADARPDLVHRRSIYKDTHGATRPWADYQLRCNYVVAMTVAPELFDARHAWAALDQAEALLLAPLGLRTLDPADWNYRPNYDNSDDSDDAAVAHGYNYHQGPEWTWPLGFYVRARLAFAHENGKHARTVAAGYAALGPLLAALRRSPWRGCPELTDAGGAPCRDSCGTQAWSSGTALEALHALAEARRARPLSD